MSLYRVALAICGLGALVLAWSIISTNRQGKAERGTRPALWLAGLACEGIAVVPVLASLSERWATPPDAATITLAMACELWGITALIGAAVALRGGLAFRADPVSDQPLIRHGIFRIVRHPFYSGLAAISIGAALLLASSLGAVLSFALVVIGIELRIYVEDRALMRHFGEAYVQYRREVARYLPLIR
jgi:protein-S-isoprenylcysteine O-methyltransferase Ste14